MLTDKLLSKYPILSKQMTRDRLRLVLVCFEQVLKQGIAGDVVEFGCHIGTTSLFLRRLLDAYHESGKRELHAYDSFAGLPNKSPQDASAAGEQFRRGELAVGKKYLLHEFRKANLQPPVIHKAWFSDLKPSDVPQRIAFAFLDGDFYDSIRDSLRIVWSALVPGAIITVDDFGREALPGAERAVRDFLQDKQTNSLHVEHNIAIIKP